MTIPLTMGVTAGPVGEPRWVPDPTAAAGRVSQDPQLVETPLAPRPRPTRPYSVRVVRAFDRAVAAFRAATDTLGDGHATPEALGGSVVLIAQGCRHGAGRDKAAAFRDAHERAAEALALLHREGGEAAARLAANVEQQYLPVLAGLVRRYERHIGA